MRNFNLHSISTGIALAVCFLISYPVDAHAQRRPSSTRTEQSRNENRQQINNGRRTNSNRNSQQAKVNNSNNNRKQKEITNNRPNNDRPKENARPSNNIRPNNNARPNNTRPGNNANHKPAPHHSVNHHSPVHHHHHHYTHHRPIPRVAPPPHWHPHHKVPVIRGILGLTFGTYYNATLDYLRQHNYAIYRYANNVIYLNNVMQYNLYWDDVVLNYATNRFASAQFIFSTSHYSTDRYNNVYLTLCNTYGSPISMRTLNGGGYECVWYGSDRYGMVSLEYYPQNGRFYTALSFGTY
ncbi:MAG: hypothetical protein E7080_07440 [Bacteroidales bacterium]|nr:hypothetical protein [Bacteroidales bacterium]